MMSTTPAGTESLRQAGLTKADTEKLLHRHLVLRDARMLGPLSNAPVQAKTSKARTSITSFSMKDACSVSLPCTDPGALALYQQSLGLVSRSGFVEKLSPSSKPGVHQETRAASPDQPGSPLQQALASRSSPGMMFHSPTPRPGDRVEDSRATDLSDRRYSPYRLHRRPSSTSPTRQTQPVKSVSQLHSPETTATLTTSVTPSSSSLTYRNYPQVEVRSPLTSSNPPSESDVPENLNHFKERDSSPCDIKINHRPHQGKLDSLLSKKISCGDAPKRQDQERQSRSPVADTATSQPDHQSASSSSETSPKSTGVLTPPPPLKSSLPVTLTVETPETAVAAAAVVAKSSLPSSQPSPPSAATSTSPPNKPANKPTAFSVVDILDPSKFTGSSSVPRVPVWNPWKVAAPARQVGRIGRENGRPSSDASAADKLGE